MKKGELDALTTSERNLVIESENVKKAEEVPSLCKLIRKLLRKNAKLERQLEDMIAIARDN